jgi:hypothetical protein
MKVIGALSLFVAASLAWAAHNNYNQAGRIKSEINALPEWQKIVFKPVNDFDKNVRVRGMEDTAQNSAIGAAIFGLLGLVLCSRRTNAAPKQAVPVRAKEIPAEPGSTPSAASRPSLELRLANLKGLLSKGLITQQEYESRRQRVLDDL